MKPNIYSVSVYLCFELFKLHLIELFLPVQCTFCIQSQVYILFQSLACVLFDLFVWIIISFSLQLLFIMIVIFFLFFCRRKLCDFYTLCVAKRKFFKIVIIDRSIECTAHIWELPCCQFHWISVNVKLIKSKVYFIRIFKKLPISDFCWIDSLFQFDLTISNQIEYSCIRFSFYFSHKTVTIDIW